MRTHAKIQAEIREAHARGDREAVERLLAERDSTPIFPRPQPGPIVMNSRVARARRTPKGVF